MSLPRLDELQHRSPNQILMVRSRVAASRTMRPVPPLRTGTAQRHPSRRHAPSSPAAHRARVVHLVRPHTEEGAGKAGRWPRPWPACSKKAGGSHHRSGRNTRPSLRDGWNGLYVVSLVRRARWPPSRARCASTATCLIPALGYQDRTISPCAKNRSSARREATLRFPAPIASHLPRLVTVATRPSGGSRTGMVIHCFGKKKRNIFGESEESHPELAPVIPTELAADAFAPARVASLGTRQLCRRIHA